ncbi:encapsulin [Streptomyces sp. NPDC058637]|uniref:encapsulin n=1 Tax=Streptomyces sp. NPDC058637 TaxID=3346569 RepID=UPI00364D4ED6
MSGRESCPPHRQCAHARRRRGPARGNPLTGALVEVSTTNPAANQPCVRCCPISPRSPVRSGSGCRVGVCDGLRFAGVGQAVLRPRPADLDPFQELRGPRHRAPATPGDLLFHVRVEQMDAFTDIELADDVKPADSHAALTTITDPDGTEHGILRTDTPFGSFEQGAFTEATETSGHGHPVATHLVRLLDEPVLRAPAVTGGVLLSTRGGDFELRLGQDLSIGYLDHDATSIRLYFHQAFTFRMLTPEAVVPIIA